MCNNVLNNNNVFVCVCVMYENKEEIVQVNWYYYRYKFGQYNGIENDAHIGMNHTEVRGNIIIFLEYY